MKISVLTVCFNSADTMHYTLTSFLSQSWPHKEMVIVDGGSTDGTQDIVRSLADENIQLISEPDDGMYDALNKALGLYTGDAFGVLNSDDTFHDREALTHIAHGLSSAEIVHGSLDFVEDHHNKRIMRQWRSKPRPKGGFRTGWMPAHPTFYCRRQVAEAVGNFDCRLRTAADYDWMLRATEMYNFSVHNIARVLVDMQQGGKSTSNIGSHILHNIEALQSRKRWLRTRFIDYAFFAKPAGKFSQFIPGGAKAKI